MANNISPLIHDAFTVYAESYRKIGQLGFEIAGEDGSPLQPAKMQQLTYATRLFRVIEPSVILNGNGTAIVGIVGEVSTINNLLLKLKRVLKLFTVPVFPTPLTNIVINLGSGGGADADATYITVVTEGGLPQSRRLAAGSGTSLTDNGPQGTMEINATGALTSVQVDYSVNPVLNFATLVERLFYGNQAINGLRTWSLTNDGNARRLQAIFSISGLTPGASTHDQTLWANVTIFTAAGSTPSANVFRPVQDGDYEIEATTYDGVNWRVNIF